MSSTSLSSAVTAKNLHGAAANSSRQDLKALGSALQSGDLSSAQNAFAKLQKDAQNNPRLQKALADKNSPAGKDFQALQSALSSGNVGSAQKAYASLQKDLKGAQQQGGTPRPPDNDGDADDRAQGARPASIAVQGTTGMVDIEA